MVFFTSDTHFGHSNIIRYCNRPFNDKFEMDETIINNINSVVSPNDTLYHLGDFSFGPQDEFREKINCNNIHLIKGNHDKQIQYNLFASVKDMNEYKDKYKTIVLCHYSMRVWNKKHHNSWHLFGHSHGTLEDFDLSFDCGVDSHDFKPWSIDEIASKMQSKLNSLV